MKFSTKKYFYANPLDIQKAYIFGWAVSVLELNEELSSEAECSIDNVRPKDNGIFAIDYSWIAGQTEVYPAYRDTDTNNWMKAEVENVEESSTFVFDPFANSAFEFHNDLCENVKYDDEYDANNEPNSDDLED